MANRGSRSIAAAAHILRDVKEVVLSAWELETSVAELIAVKVGILLADEAQAEFCTSDVVMICGG